MKCEYPELNCLVRKGKHFNFNKCILENDNKKIEIVKKCPLTRQECVRNCEWFDTDTDKCVVWKLVGK